MEGFTYAVELAGKNLEHDQCEAELAEAGPDVGALEGALGGADFDEFLGGEDHTPGSVETETVAG